MTVVAFPVPQRLCGDCEHGYLGSGGVFCVAYGEHINNERTAETCESYDGPAPESEPEGVTTAVVIRRTGRARGKGVWVVDDDLVEVIDLYLRRRHTTTWGRSFEVISAAGRLEAASWLAEQIRGLGAIEDGPG
jgi:hypothetical protein